ITGPAAFNGVDIAVTAAEIATVTLRARFEDGTPATEAGLDLSFDGYGSRGAGHSDANGIARVRIVKGMAVYLLGGVPEYLRKGAPGGCLTPQLLGPDQFPTTIDVTLRQDGCREAFNLGERGMLETSVKGPMSTMNILVTFSDGSPAYKANVSIMSR